MEFAIYLPKMVWLSRNEKQTCWLNSRPQMWTSDLTLAMTLTLNFQGQIWNLLYLNQKWSDCHKTKSKHIDLTPGLKCDQWFDLGLDLDIWIFKVKCDLDHLVTKVRGKDLPDSDRGDFRCRRAVDSSSLNDYIHMWHKTTHEVTMSRQDLLAVFPKSRQHVCFVRRRIQMSDVGFVKIISIWCLSAQFGRRSMKSIREDCACLFSKSSLAWLQEFWNSSIFLYEIKRKNLFKSTCPSSSFTCPGSSGSGKLGALHALPFPGQ